MLTSASEGVVGFMNGIGHHDGGAACVKFSVPASVGSM